MADKEGTKERTQAQGGRKMEYKKFYKRIKSRSTLALQQVHDAFTSRQSWKVAAIDQ